jgi:hypothetical protein
MGGQCDSTPTDALPDFLWTAGEGRSDLSLECTLTDRQGDLLKAEVDNLHVLRI